VIIADTAVAPVKVFLACNDIFVLQLIRPLLFCHSVRSSVQIDDTCTRVAKMRKQKSLSRSIAMLTRTKSNVSIANAAVTTTAMSEDGDFHMETASEYELQRQQRIQENRRVALKLGLESSSSITKDFKAAKHRAKVKKSKETHAATRFSRRIKILNGEEVEEEEIVVLDESVTEDEINGKRYRLGGRIYDSVNGVTCHQCRQKTIDEKTTCNDENVFAAPGKHHFCKVCLKNRYGEELEEVNKSHNWICPYCRGICNCSFCRASKGKTPTGILFPEAKSRGFDSVAHYLASRH